MMSPNPESPHFEEITSRNFKDRQRGASLVGYGLIVGLIAVAAILALRNVGDEVATLFGSVSSQMETVSGGITNSEGGNNDEEPPENIPPSLIGGNILNLGIGPFIDEDITSDILALFEDVDGDTPLALFSAIDEGSSCILDFEFNAGDVIISTDNADCSGNITVEVSDSLGAVSAPASIQINVTETIPAQFSQGDGTPIGDVGQDVAGHNTFGANIAAAYDGNTSQPLSGTARRNDNRGFALIGKDWGMSVQRVVTRFELYSSNDQGFHNPNNGDNRVLLQGSNDGTSFVTLHTSSDLTDISGLVVFDEILSPAPNPVTDAYRYHRIRIEVLDNPGSNNCCNIAEARFYGYQVAP